MKQFGILVFLVHVVVEMFAKADAGVIFSSQAHDAVLKAAGVKHMRPSFKELLEYVDTKPVPPQNCSCDTYELWLTVTECDCYAYVNDSSSGIKGTFISIMLYIQEEVIAVLALDENFVVSGSAKVGQSDAFTVVACNQSEVTKGKNVCILVDGHRSKATKQITECVRVQSPPLDVDLGCFSFTYENDGEAIQSDGSLKFVDTKQKLRTLLKRSYFP